MYDSSPEQIISEPFVIRDHTVSPDNRHKWTHLVVTVTPARETQRGWYSSYLPQRDGRLSWP